MPATSPQPAQHTLAAPCRLQGIGLHSGQMVTAELQPAPAGTGWQFVRRDLPGTPVIQASLESVVPAALSTLLRQGTAEVRTVEHLLAALAGWGIDNCRIELDGPEVPILDGSSLPYGTAIAQVGRVPQAPLKQVVAITQPVTVWGADAFITAVPSPQGRYTYGIDFDRSPIGQQWFSWDWDLDTWTETFARAIAPARTFTRQQDATWAAQQGLIKGGSLDNAIVCNDTHWLSPLRFDDEPVRHKLIDLLGDLSLTGILWQGHILAYKAGHRLHAELAKQLLATHADWAGDRSNL